MGLGVIIAAGEENELLSSELLECITEVRVEQTLDNPIHFALRFQEDLQDGEPRVRQTPELQAEQILTIAVEVGDEIKCLVRGPITETKGSTTLGGPGSWYEVRGQDRRIEMSRVCARRAWIGRASEVAQSILSSHGFTPETQETTRVYEENTGTLNQRATDLDFVKQLARTNNLCFWISYECQSGGLNPLGADSLTIEEIANFTSSPARPEGGLSLPLPQIPLVASTDVVFRVNVEPGRCQNVTSFDLNVDSERAFQFSGSAVDDRSARAETTSALDTQPSIFIGGDPLPSLAPSERSACLTVAGNQEELQTRSEAALTDAGWFITASATTTAHLLAGIVQPHDVVPVEGLGTRDSGDYHVSSVTHVINGADHHMDVQLRRNSLGK
ncbi:MAG TPA: hypothetical protein VIT21_02490 [Chthoniobacterales bacterium]